MSTELDWVRVNMERLTTQLDKLSGQMEDVRERLIRMEASAVHTAVEELKSQLSTALLKIDLLEQSRDLQAGTIKGAVSAAEWAHKLAPWVMATGLVVLLEWQKLFG